VREGKDKGQGVGYLNDGTMVVRHSGQAVIGPDGRGQESSASSKPAPGVIIFGRSEPACPRDKVLIFMNLSFSPLRASFPSMEFVTVYRALNVGDAGTVMRSRSNRPVLSWILRTEDAVIGQPKEPAF